MSKLVRDKIPGIIARSGKECSFRIADPKEHIPLLIAKLKEETQELIDVLQNEPVNKIYLIDEIADVKEVLNAIGDEILTDSWWPVMCWHKAKKRSIKGSFKNFYVLEEVRNDK